MEKEYIVSLKKGVDYDAFWNEIENASDEDGFVPSRRVDIVNNRDASLRSCHYALTDSEAELLRQDPRVFGVEIPPQQRDDLVIGHNARQSSNFTKTTSDSGNYVNWGLRRCISQNNPYGTSTTVSGDYTYTLDGTGVDVVIHDSGLEVGHPEFTDANGMSRVQQIDWYSASGVSGTQSVNHYRDYDGHGTHVGGIVAGKTYGWAKNARIYSLKVSGLEGSGDENTGISITDCFDVVKLWHRNKPVDPVTGYKRPTIVNMSWGYGAYFSNITGGSYRGVAWTGTSRDTSKGMIGSSSLFGYRHAVRVSSVDSDLQELIDEGVHVCIAAGNSYQKIDVSGGLDYDNYYTSSFYGNVYYHRGSSPYSTEAFMVGSIDSTSYSSSLDQKSVFSESGPGVDIYAPGSDIMSSCSNTNAFSALSYYLNSSYKQTNISGTSMASPQVCGVGALYLQLYPQASNEQLKTLVHNSTVTSTMYDTGLDNDYTNQRSIRGGPTRYLYMPYNSEVGVRTSGSVSLLNINFR